MKRLGIAGLTFSVISVSVSGCFEHKPTDVYISPDGNYVLEVYQVKSSFAMPGQGSDVMAYIIIKNNEGETIGKTTDECGIIYQDIEVSWDLLNHWVFYGTAHGFNLATGLCEC